MVVHPLKDPPRGLSLVPGEACGRGELLSVKRDGVVASCITSRASVLGSLFQGRRMVEGWVVDTRGALPAPSTSCKLE